MHLNATAPTDDEQFACDFRGPVLRAELCRLCGSRGKPVDVHRCFWFGECTIHAAGLRPVPSAPKLPVCVGCEHRTSGPSSK